MTISQFNVSIEERYFEDYLTGAVYEFGSITVKQDAIIEFGAQFDPQPFHTDPDLARESAFGLQSPAGRPLSCPCARYRRGSEPRGND